MDRILVFGSLAIGLASVAFGIGIIGVSLYGLYLAFSASVLLGILALLIEPSPLIFGLFMLFANVNLAERIVAWASTL